MQKKLVTPFSGMRLGMLSGVEIMAYWSLLIVFGLVLVSLGGGLLPRWHPVWNGTLTWGVDRVSACLFFLSILAHEMSHALVARAHDIPVRGITLFMFGGIAHIEGEPGTPKSEFLMAIAGPITSLLIGFASTAAGW